MKLKVWKEPKEKLSKKYGEFKKGAWVPYPVGVRKYQDTKLKKGWRQFKFCPFCGEKFGVPRESSKINSCPGCKSRFVVTAFYELPRNLNPGKKEP